MTIWKRLADMFGASEDEIKRRACVLAYGGGGSNPHTYDTALRNVIHANSLQMYGVN